MCLDWCAVAPGSLCFSPLSTAAKRASLQGNGTMSSAFGKSFSVYLERNHVACGHKAPSDLALPTFLISCVVTLAFQPFEQVKPVCLGVFASLSCLWYALCLDCSKAGFFSVIWISAQMLPCLTAQSETAPLCIPWDSALACETKAEITR